MKNPIPTLARDRCAILPLVMKGVWFDMIERGEKRLEYRRCDHWYPRVVRWTKDALRYPVVEMRRGYGADAPRLAFVCGYLRNENGAWRRLREPYEVRSKNWPVQHPELGEEPIDRIILFLGERVRLVPPRKRAKKR